MDAIATRGLSRRFRAGGGVDTIDLRVPTGSLYGFLGPNGAGKTTTIRLLLGLLRPQSGRIEIDGQPLDAQRAALRKVGAMVESPTLYPHLSARDNLRCTQTLLGLPAPRIDEVLEIVSLRDAANQKVREFSLGMRQRLGIALALLASPRLLILDEPSNGLDPAGMADMRRLLQRFTREGITVFLSSHLLAEIEQMASHVGVIERGRLRFQGTLPELQALAQPSLRIRCSEPARAQRIIEASGQRAQVLSDGEVVVEAPTLPVSSLTRALFEGGLELHGVRESRPTLEDLFLTMTEQQKAAA